MQASGGLHGLFTACGYSGDGESVETRAVNAQRTIYLFAAVLVSCLPATWAGETAKCEREQVALSSDEALLVRLINQERLERELSALELDPRLVAAARKHSRDMATRSYFSHLAPAPRPRTPADRYAAEIGRRPEVVVGENIGRADQPLMGLIHARMMESRDHRANIIDFEYALMGVGVYAQADGRVWVTQVFRGPSPPDAPTSGS